LGKNIYDPYLTSDPAHCNLVLTNDSPLPLGSQHALNHGQQWDNSQCDPHVPMSPQTQNLLKLLPTGATLNDPTLANFSGSGSNVLNAVQF